MRQAHGACRRPDAATKSHHSPAGPANCPGTRGVPFDDTSWVFEPKCGKSGCGLAGLGGTKDPHHITLREWEGSSQAGAAAPSMGMATRCLKEIAGRWARVWSKSISSGSRQC